MTVVSVDRWYLIYKGAFKFSVTEEDEPAYCGLYRQARGLSVRVVFRAGFTVYNSYSSTIIIMN